jgi:plasmid segregation protein ParM
MQNKTCLVAIDHGNKMIKGTSGVQYNSGYINTGKQEPIVKGNLLLYKNEYYSIGQGRFPVMANKTIDDRFFTLTLPLIASAIESEGIHGSEIDVLLGTGLPISNYSRIWTIQGSINY